MSDTPPGSAAWELPAHEVRQYAPRQRPYALVIPVLNEGERIRAQLRRLAQVKPPVDIVVADGGSSDDSLADGFIRTVPVRAVLVKTGSGRLSAQLRMGYAWCLREAYDGIVTMDGNGKDNVEAVAEFVIRLSQGFDYVQGSRYRPGGVAENTPLARTIGNRLVHAPLLSLAARHRLTDTTNGFRGYSRRFLLDPRVAPFRDVFQHYELLFYLTVRAGQLGYRVCEIPVTRRYPKHTATPTKIRGIAGPLAILAQTIRAAAGSYRP